MWIVQRERGVSLLEPPKGGDGETDNSPAESWRFEWNWRNFIPSLPILTWLPTILGDKNVLISDIMAGFTVAVMVVPQVSRRKGIS